MQITNIEILMDARSRQHLQRTGLVLAVVGLVGIVLPQVISITLSLFVAVLLIVSGLATAYLSWQNYARFGLAWLKPFILITLGMLLVFYPAAGAAALGLLLIIFFLMQAFASISFALAIRPYGGWLWTLVSGVLSLLLAVIFIVGWPFSAVALVGLFIGISLLFEGVALMMLARAANAY
jgi:uncharacterized membrane protein HdeD (DUF308 family)